MYTRTLMSSVIVFIAAASFASAAVEPAPTPKNCVEEDRGYKLINADGTIEPVRLYGAAVKKISDSSLNGKTYSQLQQFGVTTGDPREWARLFVMLCKQESGCRIARTNADGSLQKFSSTPQGERSYGPLQFNIGEYGLTSWAMVNSPSCSLEAFIRVAQQNKLFSYFGSMQRPNETLQHANWFNTTVKPFADAITLIYDPNAKDNSATYRALTPYFTDTNNPAYSTNQFKPASPFQWTQTPLGYPTQPAYPSQQAFPSNGLAQPSQLAQPSSNLASPSSPYNISTSVGVSTDSNSISSNGGSTIIVKDGLKALNIIAQPQIVRRGSSVLISWTSVNYDAGACTVTRGSTPLAGGNAGTQRLLIPQEASGSMTFRLTCMLPDNSMKQASASITIQ